MAKVTCRECALFQCSEVLSETGIQAMFRKCVYGSYENGTRERFTHVLSSKAGTCLHAIFSYPHDSAAIAKRR